jgi:hypothetical protein
MPIKAKEKVEEIEKKDKKLDKKEEKKLSTKKSTTSKKTTTAKKSADSAKKTSTTKKATTKKTATNKTTTAKKTTTSKKAPAKKTTTKKTSTAKKAVAKKDETVKKTTTRKRTTKKAEKTVEAPVTPIIEYYDLPYKYGHTVVRLLAQTPKTLFVYWEVSDHDIKNFKELYGDDFFSKTKPILIVHNLTLNKTNIIEINDFANCWYLNTEDSDCKYDIELARKFIETTSNENDDANINNQYLYIAKSNNLQSPNNHILFEKIQEFVIFRNANNDNVIKKNIKSFKFLKDIYKFYKEMYDEDVLNNPSSQFKF